MSKALYVLAGYDSCTEEVLSSIQNKLYDKGFSGIQTKDIPMHFTVGMYSTDREEEIKARLIKSAETHRAFDADFNHVGIFRLPENDVLFIKPEISKEMLAFKGDFTDSMDMYKWSPHTTMLIDKPDIIHEAIPVVLTEFAAFSGKVSYIHLYEFWPTRHILTVQLGEA